MMVKYLTDAEKTESRPLWEEAFPEDSSAFVDYYFSEKLRDNRILGMVEPSICDALQAQAAQLEHTWRLESMVQRNPYRVQAGSQRWVVDYIVGVATRREKRRLGCMSALLSRALNDMRAERMPFCFLMPANAEIYRPFGFTYVFSQPQWAFHPGVRGKLTVRSLLPWCGSVEYMRRAAETVRFMNDWLESRYQVYTLRDENYVLRLLDEIASEEGSFDVFYEGNAIVAVQSEWGVQQREQRLLYAKPELVDQVGEPKPAIMARVICPETFVKAIHLKKSAAAELRLLLRLRDPVINGNNCTWFWQLDQRSSCLERIGEDGKMRLPEQEKPDLALTMPEFTAWLFGAQVPAAAERFADQIETLSGVFLDEVV